MARYLRSQTTGVVLPYNEELLTRSNVELMTDDECAKYESEVRARLAAKANPAVATQPPPVPTTPTPAPVLELEPEPKPELKPEPKPEPETTAEELLGALEAD